MACQPGTTYVIKQIALFYNVAARFSKKKESYYQANVNKISRGKLQKYFYIVLII